LARALGRASALASVHVSARALAPPAFALVAQCRTLSAVH
jgi:hypothetical protein